MKNMKKLLAALLVVVLAFGLAACGKASDGKTHLTFQIWDVNQRDGMQAVCDAYTAKNPDVVIEVQVTSWYGESGQPCLVPDFSGIVSSFSPFTLMLATGLL